MRPLRTTPKESALEKHFVKRLRDFGALVYKFTSPGNAAVPDRIVILPNGQVHWVELKAEGEKPSALQKAEHAKLRALGQNVWVAAGRDQIDLLLREFTNDASSVSRTCR